jgi:cell pole-organizing protein PopZ
MEAALAAIRRVFAEQDVSETTLARVKQRTSGEEVKTKHGAELLSREATVAISSAIDTLAKTVKKQEPTLEEVVREALRPMLNSWVASTAVACNDSKTRAAADACHRQTVKKG